MNAKIVFWAQALDNTSPNHIALLGELLVPDDSAKRHEAVSLISSVAKAGSRIFVEHGVQLIGDERRFIIEVPSVERDEAGRIAPIVCCGEYDSTVDAVFSESVVVEFNNFAKLIGRNILPEHCELVRESFRVLKKKSSTRRLVRLVGTGALLLCVLALTFWIISTIGS